MAEAQAARPGTYLTLTGSIVAHQRDDCFTFRDDPGEMRVATDDGLWAGRQVGPSDSVRLLGEIDQTAAGVTYLWVKSIDPVS